MCSHPHSVPCLGCSSHSILLGSLFFSKFDFWSTSISFPSLLQLLFPVEFVLRISMVVLLSLVASSGHGRILFVLNMHCTLGDKSPSTPSCAYTLCLSIHFTLCPEPRTHSDLESKSPPVTVHSRILSTTVQDPQP